MTYDRKIYSFPSASEAPSKSGSFTAPEVINTPGSRYDLTFPKKNIKAPIQEVLNHGTVNRGKALRATVAVLLNQ